MEMKFILFHQAHSAFCPVTLIENGLWPAGYFYWAARWAFMESGFA